MHASRWLCGVRRIFPFLREVAPSTLRPVPASRLAGLTVAVDATLVSTRFHFANDPHPARHLFGFYRLVRALRAVDARAIMVFDHPLGGARARNPAKVLEADRRRTQRGLIAKRASLEQHRHRRIKALAAAIRRYEGLSAEEAGALHHHLRTVREDELRQRASDPSLGEDQSLIALSADTQAHSTVDPRDLGDDLAEPLPRGGDPPSDTTQWPADDDSSKTETWDDHVDNALWDELVKDEQVATTTLSVSSEVLKDAISSTPASETPSGTDLAPHVAELVAELHRTRQEFESLHFPLSDAAAPGLARASTRDDGDVWQESKNQAILTAAEARIHETLLTRRVMVDPLPQLPIQADSDGMDVADDQPVLTVTDMDTVEVQDEATASVPTILQTDLLSDEPGSGTAALAQEPAEDPSEQAQSRYKTELQSMHTQSNALSRSYNRASTPLNPQTIIDCAYLCALLDVPVLFTSRGSSLSSPNRQGAHPTEEAVSTSGAQHTDLPGAAWAGRMHSRARAHEAEALAASLVHAGFADVVASEDSDVLMYDVPMLRGLLGGSGGGGVKGDDSPGPLKGLVWVDAREVRRTLFGLKDGTCASAGQSQVDEDEQAAENAVLEEINASADGNHTSIGDAGSAQSASPNEHREQKTSTRTKTVEQPPSPDEDNRRRFQDFALLLGTDFNRTIPGVGPKTAYNLIKEHGNIAAILRLKQPPTPERRGRVPDATKTGKARFKFQPPPPLNRRDFLLELARARSVFNHPPTLFGNVARLRRWNGGADYYDWKAAIASATAGGAGAHGHAHGDHGTSALTRRGQARADAWSRQLDAWREQEIARLFAGYSSVPKERRAAAETGFGASFDDFVHELGH